MFNARINNRYDNLWSNAKEAPGVRVWPRDEAMRVALKHPRTGVAFRGTIHDSVEWPNDAFTKKRLLSGSVRLTPPESSPSQTA